MDAFAHQSSKPISIPSDDDEDFNVPEGRHDRNTSPDPIAEFWDDDSSGPGRNIPPNAIKPKPLAFNLLPQPKYKQTRDGPSTRRLVQKHQANVASSREAPEVIVLDGDDSEGTSHTSAALVEDSVHDDLDQEHHPVSSQRPTSDTIGTRTKSPTV